MIDRCSRHTAFIYERGGAKLIAPLGDISRVQYERIRDEISAATVTIAARHHDCNIALGLLGVGRHEMVIFRDEERVWEGPITHVTYQGKAVEISARDVGHYVYRTMMTKEYDNRYPNIGRVTERVHRVLMDELVRMEAQNPPINVRPHIVPHLHVDDARTSARTLPYQMTVYEHLDSMAARGGLDYTVVGRAIHLWDVHSNAMGQTGMVSAEDFIGDIAITEYGMELATVSAVTDGKGRVGIAGAADPYYGLVEILDTAYDESSGEDWDEGDEQPEPPSVPEMRSQAQRILAGRNPTPVVVRVPDNSTLNPNGALTLADLIPGVFIPLQAELPGRTLSQMQKLDRVTVEETPSGETIKVVLSPTPKSGSNEEDV